MYIVRMRHTGFIYLTTSLIQHKFKTKKYMCNQFEKTTTHVKKYYRAIRGTGFNINYLSTHFEVVRISSAFNSQFYIIIE